MIDKLKDEIVDRFYNGESMLELSALFNIDMRDIENAIREDAVKGWSK